MKNLIFAFLFISSLSFSQETYTYKSGGRVFENNRKLTQSDIENYFGHKPEIIKLYNNGMNKKITANIFFYTGLAGTTAALAPSFYGGKEFKPGLAIVSVVTGTMFLISIPLKITYPSKIKKAIKLMNEEINSQKQNTSLNLETNIIANANGVGLKLTF